MNKLDMRPDLQSGSGSPFVKLIRKMEREAEAEAEAEVEANYVYLGLTS